MYSSLAGPPLVRVRGVIRSLDLINREMQVMTGDGVLSLDIPVDCLVFLNNERVKLRLLQPRDPVEVSYIPSNGHAPRAVEIRKPQ